MNLINELRERRSPTSHHGPPANGKKHDGYVAGIAGRIEQLKELDHETETVWYDARARHNQRPEVQASVLIECGHRKK